VTNVAGPSASAVSRGQGAAVVVKVLVTGGAGFIGSHFVRSYADAYEFTVLDKLTYADGSGGGPVAIRFS
jgi:nucleoside-diphosphate-sugar epimerase